MIYKQYTLILPCHKNQVLIYIHTVSAKASHMRQETWYVWLLKIQSVESNLQGKALDKSTATRCVKSSYGLNSWQVQAFCYQSVYNIPNITNGELLEAW